MQRTINKFLTEKNLIFSQNSQPQKDGLFYPFLCFLFDLEMTFLSLKRPFVMQFLKSRKIYLFLFQSECFTRGECQGGLLESSLTTSSATECLEICQSDSNCKYVTYYSHYDQCSKVGFQNL